MRRASASGSPACGIALRLGFTSLLADNISANVVGLVLGTAFRFLMYRYWVFGSTRRKGLSGDPGARNVRHHCGDG